jgi:PAS domain S-box-containing protein
MKQITDFFYGLFAMDQWPERWHCGNWSDFHGWLYILSDITIWAAYFAIPIIIVKYIVQKSDLRFFTIYFLFAAFILACGLTHLLDALTFWFPIYRLNALVRFVTAIISWLTVYQLLKILPQAFSLKSAEDFEVEIERTRLAQQELILANQILQDKNEELRRQSDFIKAILNSSVDYINVYNEKHELIVANRKAEEILGVSQEELIGKKVTEIFPRIETHKSYKDLIDAFKGEEISNKSSYLPLNKRYYDNYFIPLKNGNNVYAVLVIALDITDSKEKESSLQEKNKELERMNSELQQFAYVCSHDLQEPLRKIQTFMHLIQSNYSHEESEDKYISKVIESSGRMKTLVNDVLNYSRMTNVSEERERVDINEILDTVVLDYELTLLDKKAVIKYENLIPIEGIKHQITQLFSNLISNSLKFSSTHPIIQIVSKNLSALEISQYPTLHSELDYVVYIYSDNGIGFDQQYSEKIFELFQRLNDRQTYSGTGIGLALCKKIVDNHHGLILAESTLGEGAVFKIILPVNNK